MLKMALKFVFSLGLIYWLTKDGKLDFSLLLKMGEYPTHLIVGVALILFNALTATYRWKILLEIKTKEKLPFLPMARLNWIGLFFSSILPGAVTGDLIKIIYARDLNKNLSKTFLITSALLDRIIGLYGLLFLLGLSSLFVYSEISTRSNVLKSIIHMNFLIFLGMTAIFMGLFLKKSLQEFFIRQANRVPKLGPKLANTFEQIWAMGANKTTIFYCFSISVIVQASNVFSLWYMASPFYGQSVSLTHAFTFIPLGLVAIAIPIAPSGLGVGHAIFETLFRYYGVDQGASLFNIYFVAIVSVNLLGVFAYLFSGKKHGLKEVNKLEHQIESNA